MIKIAGTVNDTVNLNDILPVAVKRKIGVHRQDSVPRASEGSISRNLPQLGVAAQPIDPAIELIDKCARPSWAVLRDKIQDAQKVFLGRREVANGELSGH